MHDRAVGVPLAVADLVGVGVEPDHGLDGIPARLELVERAGEAVRPGVDSQRLARLPVLDVHGEERLGPEPVGPEPRLAPELVRREHHVNPPRDRLAPQRRRHR